MSRVRKTPGRVRARETELNPTDPKTFALRLAELAFEKKAFSLKILKVADIIGYADYLILCSGRSDRQVKAIADNIALALKKEDGRLPVGVEGSDYGQWVLMDYSDVIVHIFNAPVREYYDLDGLWQEAERVPVETPPWEEEMRNSVFEQGVLHPT